MKLRWLPYFTLLQILSYYNPVSWTLAIFDIHILEGKNTFKNGHIELTVFEYVSLSYLCFPMHLWSRFLSKRVPYHIFSLSSILVIPTLCKYIYTECLLIYCLQWEDWCITDSWAAFPGITPLVAPHCSPNEVWTFFRSSIICFQPNFLPNLHLRGSGLPLLHPAYSAILSPIPSSSGTWIYQFLLLSHVSSIFLF